MHESFLTALRAYTGGEPTEALITAQNAWIDAHQTGPLPIAPFEAMPELSAPACALLALAAGVAVEGGAAAQPHFARLAAWFVDKTAALAASADPAAAPNVPAYEHVARSIVSHCVADDSCRAMLAETGGLLQELGLLEARGVSGAIWVRQVVSLRSGELWLVDVPSRTGMRFAFENIASCATLLHMAQTEMREAGWPKWVALKATPERAWAHYTLDMAGLLARAVAPSGDVGALSPLGGPGGPIVVYMHPHRAGALDLGGMALDAALMQAPASLMRGGRLSARELEQVLPAEPAPRGGFLRRLFQRAPEPVVPQFALFNGDTETVELKSRLERAGADVKAGEGWLHTARGVALGADLEELRDAEGDVSSVRLDVTLSFPDGRYVVESFAGLGRTLADKRANAFDNMEASALQVFVDALCGQDAEVADVWDAELPGVDGERLRARLVCGHPAMRGADLEVPEGFRGAFADAVSAEPVRGGHVFRVFIAFSGEACTAVEALVDGQKWPAGEAMLRALPWQPTTAYTSLRAVAICTTDLAGARDAAGSPAPSSWTADAGVAMAVDAMRGGAAPNAVYGLMRAGGATAVQAESVAALLPMACTRVLFPQATWPDAFLVARGEQTTTFPLSESAIFRAAQRAVEALDDDARAHLSAFSAEHDALRRLTNGTFAPARLADAVFSPSVIMVGREPTIRRTGGTWTRTEDG